MNMFNTSFVSGHTLAILKTTRELVNAVTDTMRVVDVAHAKLIKCTDLGSAEPF